MTIADAFRMIFIFESSSNDVIFLRISFSSCVVIACFASSSIPHTQFLHLVFSRCSPADKQFKRFLTTSIDRNAYIYQLNFKIFFSTINIMFYSFHESQKFIQKLPRLCHYITTMDHKVFYKSKPLCTNSSR